MSETAIDSALKKFSGRPGAMGGAQAGNRDELRAELAAVATHNRVIIYIACGLATVMFAVLLVFAFKFQNDWKAVAYCFAAMGVGATGVIAFVARMADQMARAGMLAALAGQLSSEKMYAVAMAILEKAPTPK